jgi:FtsH-binding integral membrane protein
VLHSIGLKAYLQDKRVFNSSSRNPPGVMRIAQTCLWASVAIAAMLAVAVWTNLLGVTSTASLTVNNLLTLALLLWIAVKISAGRGWARWLFAVVYALGALMTLYLALFVPHSFSSMPLLLQVTGLLQLALQTTAMVLIFSPPARQWFKAQSQSNEALQSKT